ncbi:hypothetical protein B0H14DRAFT_3438613 [Mycena olivaceomarginata]|nr:hypothetical protein B0H14DRAFT_3438613 [Mycena olivaceomarginata]
MSPSKQSQGFLLPIPNSKTLWIEPSSCAHTLAPSEAEAAQDLILENIIGKIDIPERMLRRLGLSVTESVYAARIGRLSAGSVPDTKPQDVLNLMYGCYGLPAAQRVRVDHVGAASTSDAPRPKTLGILDVPEGFTNALGRPSLNACTLSTSATPPHRISPQYKTIGIKDVLERVYRRLGPPATPLPNTVRMQSQYGVYAASTWHRHAQWPST